MKQRKTFFNKRPHITQIIKKYNTLLTYIVNYETQLDKTKIIGKIYNI